MTNSRKAFHFHVWSILIHIQRTSKEAVSAILATKSSGENPGTSTKPLHHINLQNILISVSFVKGWAPWLSLGLPAVQVHWCQ